MISNDGVEVVPGMLVLRETSTNHPLHHLHIFYSLSPSRDTQQVLNAKPPYRWELHEAMGAVSSNAESFDHETVGRIGLHVERESKR